MQDDFNSARDYKNFKRLYLEADKLLDKAPGPRIRGELARKASKVNINNAASLNNWARIIKKRIVRMTALSDTNINFIPVGDWKQGTAAILEIDLRMSEILENPGQILVLVYDSSDVRVQLPKKLASLMRLKGNRKKFRNRDAAAELLSRAVNRALS